MTQRPSIAEGLSEIIRLAEVCFEEACEDGVITRDEYARVSHRFAESKRQSRLVVLSEAAALRTLRTGHVDKNQLAELRGVERAQRGRVLQFASAPAARRRAAGGTDPDSAA